MMCRVLIQMVFVVLLLAVGRTAVGEESLPPDHFAVSVTCGSPATKGWKVHQSVGADFKCSSDSDTEARSFWVRQFDQEMTSEGVIAAAGKDAYRPALVGEGIDFIAAQPVTDPFGIVVLGSLSEEFLGQRHVPVFTAKTDWHLLGGGHYNQSAPFERPWSAGTLFLLVLKKKESPRQPEKTEQEKAAKAMRGLAVLAEIAREQDILEALEAKPRDTDGARDLVEQLPAGANRIKWEMVLLVLESRLERRGDEAEWRLSDPSLWTRACEAANCAPARRILNEARGYLLERHSVRIPACQPLPKPSP